MIAARPFKKARSVNSSSANFPSWVASEYDPSFADPATAAGRVITRVSDIGGNGVTPGWLQIFPYGLGSNNDAFAFRVVGLRRMPNPIADGRVQFFRFPIASLTCILSSGNPGLALGNILTTEFFADTIAIVSELTATADVTRTGTMQIYNPVADTGMAFVQMPLLGVEAFEIEWDQTTGTPTMNALLSYSDFED